MKRNVWKTDEAWIKNSENAMFYAMLCRCLKASYNTIPAATLTL